MVCGTRIPDSIQSRRTNVHDGVQALRRLAVSSSALLLLVTVMLAQSATARIDGNQLHIVAPRVHFLIGEALSRLHDGATVRYEMELIARTDRSGRTLARAMEQF